MVRDIYRGEKVGAIGPNAISKDTTFIEYCSMAEGSDLTVLANELGKLKAEMQKTAAKTEQFESLLAVSAAEDAAMGGDIATVMEKLRATGSWVLDTATKIGVPVAVEAIKKAVGLS